MSIQTLSELFDLTTSRYNKPDHLVYRGKDGHFHNISTNEFRSRVINLALAFKELDMNKGCKLLLLSENRPEWHITDFAAHLLGVVIVPIFPTLIPDQIAYIIQHSECETIVVSNSKQLKKIRRIWDQLNGIKQVIVFDKEDTDEGSRSFEELLLIGRDIDEERFYPEALKSVSSDDLATLIYTSGTTGVPKGVMLSHGNFAANFVAATNLLDLTDADKGLSFLPLCHAFERTVDYVYFYCGCSINYCSGNEMIVPDLLESSPTIMASVPRFYEKVKTKIESKAEMDGGLKKLIFNWAMGIGSRKVDNYLDGRSDSLIFALQHRIADKLVFSKIKQRVGGKLKYFISGGAPLSAEVARFFLSAGLKILEGYGLTETAPIIAGNSITHLRLGTVGKLLDGVEAKIAEDGEIVTRGRNVMLGYYKMPEETGAVLRDGWFYTGDIGVMDDDGFLSITDRKKQLIVTSVGKKIAPQPLEKEIENSRYIDQILVIGEKRNYITALIVPDFEVLAQYCESNGMTVEDNDTLVNDEKIIQLFEQEVNQRQQKFSSYQKIQRFKLLSEPFTVENNQLTPTMKIRRSFVEKAYADEIEKMYSGNSEQGPATREQ